MAQRELERKRGEPERLLVDQAKHSGDPSIRVEVDQAVKGINESHEELVPLLRLESLNAEENEEGLDKDLLPEQAQLERKRQKLDALLHKELNPKSVNADLQKSPETSRLFRSYGLAFAALLVVMMFRAWFSVSSRIAKLSSKNRST